MRDIQLDANGVLHRGWFMAVQFKEFVRPAFSGNPEELKRKVITFCNTEIKGFKVLSISEAKGISDDFYRITVWYDDESEQYEKLLSEEMHSSKDK